MRRTFLVAFLFIACLANAQDDVTYKNPPKDIMDLALSKPTPSVTIDMKGEWLVLTERSEFPTIEDLAQPELRIAGLRINPKNFRNSPPPAAATCCALPFRSRAGCTMNPLSCLQNAASTCAI